MSHWFCMCFVSQLYLAFSGHRLIFLIKCTHLAHLCSTDLIECKQSSNRCKMSNSPFQMPFRGRTFFFHDSTIFFWLFPVIFKFNLLTNANRFSLPSLACAHIYAFVHTHTWIWNQFIHLFMIFHFLLLIITEMNFLPPSYQNQSRLSLWPA